MINAKELLAAIDLIEQEKGISKASVIAALKEAMEKAYRKQLGSIDDALVRVDLDTEKGSIKLYQLKNVVENVEDDFLEISLEEIKTLGLNLNIGDVYQIEASPEDFQKSAAITVKAILRQKIAEAEKSALFEVYKDKIGEMIVGQVEKVDTRTAIINIGRTSVFLPFSKRIPGETFKVGDRVKLYVVEVVSTTKGAQISVSRAHEGFLKRLFEEELPEIYEGTVVIKDIAREAGIRSKVAVYSLDPNVDAAGACIGQNGSRIQKIVAQLGNAKDKEKIDIIAYTANTPLYIIESMKPAQVSGIILNEDAKKATIIIANEHLGTAIGRRGVNPRLATKLTGYTIDIKDAESAAQEGLAYVTVDSLRNEDYMRKQKESLGLSPSAETFVATRAKVVRDESFTMEDVLAPQKQVVEVEAVIAAPVDIVKPTAIVTPAKVIPPVPPTTPAAPKVIAVRTTKTLEELEKELEAQKARKPKFEKDKFDRKKKPFKKRPQESYTPLVTPQQDSLTPNNYMKIYDDETETAVDPVTPLPEPEEETEIALEDFDEYYDEEK